MIRSRAEREIDAKTVEKDNNCFFSVSSYDVSTECGSSNNCLRPDLLLPSLKQRKQKRRKKNMFCRPGVRVILASRFAFGGEPAKIRRYIVFFSSSSSSCFRLLFFIGCFVFIWPVGPACYLCVWWRKLPAGNFWLFGRSDNFMCALKKHPAFRLVLLLVPFFTWLFLIVKNIYYIV